MNYFDRIPHFALFLGFRYAKCGKHGLLPGDDMADRGLKPWPDGETKNPEINAWKKPQKTSKVAKRKKSYLKLLQNLDKSQMQKCQKCPKIWKNAEQFGNWRILLNLDKTQFESWKNVQKSEKMMENWKMLLNLDKTQFESWKKCPKF